jgi:hypothetical protein
MLKKIVYVLNMGFKNKLFIYLPKVRLVTTVSNRKVPGQRDRDPFFGSCFELLFMWALAMEKIASVLPHRMRTQGTHESNSNSIYKLDIHLILAKSEKSASNRLSKQLGIYGKLPSIPRPRSLARASRSPMACTRLLLSCTRQVSLLFSPRPRWVRSIVRQGGDRHGRDGGAHLLIARQGMIPNEGPIRRTREGRSE